MILSNFDYNFLDFETSTSELVTLKFITLDQVGRIPAIEMGKD
jgi:hypothetical protein